MHSKIAMFSGLVVMARLLKRTSECACVPLCCRLIRRNDSYGILSARPCAFRGLRPPTALVLLDVLWVVVVVWGVTK